MNNVSWLDLSACDGFRRLVDSLSDDLGDRRNVLLLLPAPVPDDSILDALGVRLDERSFLVQRIYLSDDETIGPGQLLIDELGVPWPDAAEPCSASNVIRGLLRQSDVDAWPDVIVVQGLAAQTCGTRDRWIWFGREWAGLSQGVRVVSRGLPRICLVARANDMASPLLGETVGLSIRYWWGFPSVLEHSLLIRNSSDGLSFGALERWREKVIPAIAGQDIDLAEHLWREPDIDMRVLLSFLREVAASRGWTRSRLTAWNALDLAHRPSSRSRSPAPDERVRELWAQGALSNTLEHGIELSAVAQAVLGKEADIAHRLWRGQAGLLLPMLDTVRLQICGELDRRYGTKWALDWVYPETNREVEELRTSHFSCEWGHLESVLACGESQALWSRRRIVSLARHLRNELAHYKPCALKDYAEFVTEANRLGLQC
jgi:hypothetical protein